MPAVYTTKLGYLQVADPQQWVPVFFKSQQVGLLLSDGSGIRNPDFKVQWTLPDEVVNNLKFPLHMDYLVLSSQVPQRTWIISKK